ncbi:probable dicarboxylate carrier protein [Cephalotrichum gorgonifer]|uniref:Probable dicarboxylate carrier protein n=1 Tax=Cephalotrichum gorgonifer TaxID=2041049 RepID=A0AAE8SW59_9PEZI|nr:probable dicarboxylate carrier protein [Cephalotrichum gorgonifer]
MSFSNSARPADPTPEIVVSVAGAGEKKKSPAKYPFWFGGSASSMAACVTHPLDLANWLPVAVKVRLQTRSGDMPKTMSRTFVHIIKSDGISGLYSGLSASLLRQMTYSTIRFGIYEDLKARATHDGKQPGLPMLIALSTVSGLIGGVCGNAADVVNVRMQHDATLAAAHRRNYRHGVHGIYHMAKHEGFASWFRGVWPNSVRAAFMTSAQLASYDSIKRLLITHTRMGDDMATHFTASFLAGVVAATVTSPVDVVKTRVMSGHTGHGVMSVLKDLYKADGLGWMFRGWTPSFLRLGPQTISTFLFLEMHRNLYRKYVDVPV